MVGGVEVDCVLWLDFNKREVIQIQGEGRVVRTRQKLQPDR